MKQGKVKACGFLQALSPQLKKKLLESGEVVVLNSSRYLYQRGDSEGNFYIIQKGRVTLSLKSKKGGELVLRELSENDILGVESIFEKKTRHADAYAVKGVRVIKIKRSAFMTFLEGHPEVYKPLAEFFCNMTSDCVDVIEDMFCSDLMRRIVSRLVLLSEGSNDLQQSLIEIKQEDLAKILGVSREIINRNLRLLQKRGLLLIRRKALLVPNIKKLKLILEG